MKINKKEILKDRPELKDKYDKLEDDEDDDEMGY